VGSTRGLAAIFAHFGTHIVAMEDELLRVKLDAAWVGGKGACWHLVFEAPRYCIRQGVARQHETVARHHVVGSIFVVCIWKVT